MRTRLLDAMVDTMTAMLDDSEPRILLQVMKAPKFDPLYCAHSDVLVQPNYEVTTRRHKRIVNRRTEKGRRIVYRMVRICECNNQEMLQYHYEADAVELEYPISRKLLAGALRVARKQITDSLRRHEQGLE